MDTERFKAEVAPHLETALVDNGGADRVRKIYGLMSGVIDFIAGWTCCAVVHARRNRSVQFVRAARGEPDLGEDLSHEEIRRIYDLTRLRLDTGSSTS